MTQPSGVGHAVAAGAAAAAPPNERRWWTLAAVCGATFMLLVDVTIVQVALPTMQRTLHASFSDLQWVISAYALTLSALLLTQGSLADRFGRKRVFMAGLAVFSVASLACGLATSAGLLIAARAVQGVGGAGMFATGLALIGQDFRGKERGTAIAAWGATVGGAVAVGPLVGGALTSAFGWPWIFYVNVPIGALTLAVSAWRMVNMRDPGAKRLDLAGLVTFSGSLFFLVLGLTRGNDDGWSSRPILVYLCAAALLMLAFVTAELRQERPMFDLSLFRNPGFVGVSIATFGIGAGMFAMFPYLTLYLQNDLGLSPLQGGLRLLPMTILSFIVPLLVRPLSERLAPGLVLGSGFVICAAGVALMHMIGPQTGFTALVPGFVVAGFGVGIANPAIARIALGVVAPERSGMASGISNTFRIGGLATGVSALGAIFEQRLGASLHQHLGHVPAGLTKAVAAGGLRAAGTLVHGAPAVVTAARASFVTGMQDLFVVGAAAIFGGGLFATFVRSRDFHQAVWQPPVMPALEPEAEPLPEPAG
ncbi:MAG TPA: MFS transporter [Acidimicrobiales bacterium]|nr:MFS transporter [Acidimicrobiales bacterium]